MAITDINRKFTEIVSDYIRRGFTINIGTMGGSQGEEGHVDLTNGEIVIAFCLTGSLIMGSWVSMDMKSLLAQLPML